MHQKLDIAAQGKNSNREREDIAALTYNECRDVAYDWLR
jgi:hypothetical protein